MEYRIQLFAGLADTIGSPAVSLAAPAPSMTVAALKELLAASFPQAAGQLQQAFIAVNQAYAAAADVVTVHDEIAVIPPVSGGEPGPSEAERPDPAEARELFGLTRQTIDPNEVLSRVLDPNHGASLLFVGTTREWTHGQRTVRLDYEAYEPMALRTMRQIGEEIAARWPGTRTAITHRLGEVAIGEASVVIAVSAPHRADCYEASRYAIERLKQIVPIWKKELWEDGYEWKGHQLGPWDPTRSQT
ncbi:molybdopterin converting factor [Gordoniibacillus kamchatkensis]|uniref:Molybdopterin converting factor n=1 Tax=Gordoniibacillus kamchatkensis TaxID=1590651 RepID=A0ABR5AN02_9BACL|nr:molybdenum cofactor biosynthesis protein MoaE [Paenibacillus sp. VKM B-2647]KIL42405.1 molybdopterin converting factor [Paenibacillus sp. VKM B-2647]